MFRAERLLNNERLGSSARPPAFEDEARTEFIENLYWVAYLSIIACYAQMFSCLRELDKEHNFDMIHRIPRIISTFRAGCILKGALLEPMTQAFREEPNLPNLMCAFAADIHKGLPLYKKAVATLLTLPEPTPVIFASLGYIQSMTTSRLQSAQMVALQRDVFGRHGFKRIVDGAVTEESFNAQWNEMQ